MSKRRANTQQVASNPKKPCKVQSTLFKFFEKSQDHASSSEPLRQTLDFSPQNYGIHLYSKDEIDNVAGLRQEFRKHWNEKATELCKDKSVRDKLHNKKAIEGAIYASWRLKSTRLLQIQAEEVIEDSESFINDDVAREHFLTAIKRNRDRMLQAYDAVNHLYQLMSTSTTQEIKSNLEPDLEKEMSQLKSAQATLKKTISDKQQQMSLERAVLQHEAEFLDAEPPVKLYDDDITLLVETVRNEMFDKESGNDVASSPGPPGFSGDELEARNDVDPSVSEQ